MATKIFHSKKPYQINLSLRPRLFCLVVNYKMRQKKRRLNCFLELTWSTSCRWSAGAWAPLGCLRRPPCHRCSLTSDSWGSSDLHRKIIVLLFWILRQKMRARAREREREREREKDTEIESERENEIYMYIREREILPTTFYISLTTYSCSQYIYWIHWIPLWSPRKIYGEEKELGDYPQALIHQERQLCTEKGGLFDSTSFIQSICMYIIIIT